MSDFASAIEQAESSEDLSADQTSRLIDQMLRGDADEPLVADLLLALRAKGESVSELVGAARAMRRHMTPIRHNGPILLDTCGTGGSGSGTFNISTVTAIVVAATGIPVAKHGNRKATSKSGSADVLSELGVAIESDVDAVERSLREVGLCFCFAPKLHPAMRHVASVRRQLGVPTLFNLLGPLCNPAGATHQLLGTSTKTAQEKIAAALAELGTQRSAVVCGEDGQDEVTLDGPTTTIEIHQGGTAVHHWTAADFGLNPAGTAGMQAEDPRRSAAIIKQLLQGEHGPCRDIVLANAAAALWLVGRSDSLQAAVAIAAEAIDSGAAWATLQQLVAQHA